ncbi:hypothetical protein F0L74_29455 [Chitinophaga agrisoli]|uniref:Uncharacterized protein n=1 Tax=Chitinophaga agrisoli TaxID=2607653 RepID=A0A5B2VPS1_9BACT|nr:hypothetical protein [Chitinophaga agrisoli]KAA2240292.1 hypothetical protein F0L74_29455 [Chitinophaga agrisoli]
MTILVSLYETLQQRKRPEDVADMVMELLQPHLTPQELKVLDKAAAGSLKRGVHGYTSMAEMFMTAVGAEKQVKAAIPIFKLEDIDPAIYNSYANIEAFINQVSPLIQKAVGGNNFKADRLNKAQRKERGMDLSKRNYNKKWRLLKRLEEKLLTFARETRKHEFERVAKHGLFHQLDLDTFAADLDTACFIAYYTSRCNMRSEFTIQGQQRAFDEICEMLLNRCKRSGKAGWWAIAHGYASQEVLAQLSDEQKGMLLGKWTLALQDIAAMLEDVWSYSNINRDTMVVKAGNDSSTWNNTAGAWNKARDHWMHLIYALGMEDMLDKLCFGKVLRLMAADVVAWHYLTGGKLDPNTGVWNKLPLPWEVFNGRAACNRQMVATACQDAGMDAEKSGWLAPRLHGVAAFRPTPQLVHGVTVSNPFLATVLKKHGYFSGKQVTPLSPENN